MPVIERLVFAIAGVLLAVAMLAVLMLEHSAGEVRGRPKVHAAIREPVASLFSAPAMAASPRPAKHYLTTLRKARMSHDCLAHGHNSPETAPKKRGSHHLGC